MSHRRSPDRTVTVGRSCVGRSAEPGGAGVGERGNAQAANTNTADEPGDNYVATVEALRSPTPRKPHRGR